MTGEGSSGKAFPISDIRDRAGSTHPRGDNSFVTKLVAALADAGFKISTEMYLRYPEHEYPDQTAAWQDR